MHAIIVLGKGNFHIRIAVGITVLVIVLVQGSFAPPPSVDIGGY